MSSAKTYLTTKPSLEGIAVGSRVTAAEVRPFGGVERLLELQIIRDDGEVPAADAVAESAPAGRKSTKQGV